jgi:hypothetical protein
VDTLVHAGLFLGLDGDRSATAPAAVRDSRSLLIDQARGQPLPLRKVVSQELEMPNGPNLAFFTLIAASLCAAVVLVGLLIAGDVAGPRVVTTNLPPHSQEGGRQ